MNKNVVNILLMFKYANEHRIPEPRLLEEVIKNVPR